MGGVQEQEAGRRRADDELREVHWGVHATRADETASVHGVAAVQAAQGTGCECDAGADVSRNSEASDYSRRHFGGLGAVFQRGCGQPGAYTVAFSHIVCGRYSPCSSLAWLRWLVNAHRSYPAHAGQFVERVLDAAVFFLLAGWKCKSYSRLELTSAHEANGRRVFSFQGYGLAAEKELFKSCKQQLRHY
eukprot:6189801-Pleurochrysis_carterae.AAC.1